jgi:cell fate regulator YaaT (PSP1 superfamily)
MSTVVGIRFKKAGKIYYFDPKEFDIKAGEDAIVETARGVEFGHVMVGRKEISEEDIVAPLKEVIRIATDEDRAHHLENKQKAKEAFEVCLEKIEHHELDMKLIDVEYTFDNNKVIFYFTADGRVDFRELVKDLASVFRTRIELRQIGVRDEAKMIGGYGSCGRPLCCSTFLGDFAPVSIKMAKQQGLSLNPSKISGVCGRLMCCLNYEEETYKECKKCLPKQGQRVQTEFGEGMVIDVNVLTQKVKVRVRNEDDIMQVMTLNASELKKESCCASRKEEMMADLKDASVLVNADTKEEPVSEEEKKLLKELDKEFAPQKKEKPRRKNNNNRNQRNNAKPRGDKDKKNVAKKDNDGDNRKSSENKKKNYYKKKINKKTNEKDQNAQNKPNAKKQDKKPFVKKKRDSKNQDNSEK